MMSKKFVIVLLVIAVLIPLLSHFASLHAESIQVIQLMKSNSPIVGIDKIKGDEYLLTFMKTFVKRGNNVTVYFGEGKISIVRINLKKRKVVELWNYTLKGYRIFSFPCITNDSIIIASVCSPNLRCNSDLLKISLNNYRVERIANLREYVLKIKKFKDGSILAMGFNGNKGKITIIKNSSIIFEKTLGDRVLSGLILDLNKDGREDFVVSSAVFGNNTTNSIVTFFINEGGSFREIKKIEVPGMVWDMKFVKLGKKTIALLTPKYVYLLDATSMKVRRVFATKKGYFLSSVEVLDFDHDGFSEFFGVYHNETKRYFVELKYLNGELHIVFKRPSVLCFIVKWMNDGNFLVGGTNGGLYLISLKTH